ncbi:hypothetical protein A1O1_04972 [Capronia coronata CBS 617.96]|uniref:NACHT domain-containing protein n=1 Tax=Capronia coronata CBS 617.96 TaxID=1182541 RepID=W9YEF4_9EURO|nr:uncharacterized protein A1O1_04972 [Capronia coronata CBS 617.96]EXJ88045.1 hypothetical protein A1O1_04972 [Capronia coronata CBS 617.96]
MTDPFSAATGVAGLISLAGFVLGRCYRYGCGVADAPSEAKRLVSEVTGLSGILVGVQGLIKQSDQAGKALETVCADCKASLETLALRLQKHSPGASKSTRKQTVNRLLWPLRRSETEELINALERHKASLSLALDSLSAEALTNQRTTLDTVSDAVAALSSDLRSSQAADERRNILDWLSDYEHEAQYRRGFQLYCSQTCNWLLNHPEFHKWCQMRSSLLWMHGQAGSGKTVATSYLIHHLANANVNGPLLAYFYYDASTIESLTPETFFGAILKQFCAQLAQIPDGIVDAYQRAASRLGTPKQPSPSDLKRLLQIVLDGSRAAVILIDGLDESPDYPPVCDFLTSTVAAGQSPLRVFISSRPEVDLQRRLRSFQHIPVPEYAVEEDISVYIKTRIHTDPRLRRMSEKMKDYVEQTLRLGSHGMFRWVQCQLDEISHLRTDAAVKRALHKLPSSLEGSYLRILQKINREDIIFARRTMLWLAYASHPLTPTELAEAIVLDPEFDDLDPDAQLNDPNDILEICGSLITFSTAAKTARIAHHSVREYLTERVHASASATASTNLSLSSEFHIPPTTSHRTIAQTCLSYLLLPEFSAGPLHEADFRWTLSHYPLLRYGAHKWPFHVHMSGAESQLLPLIRRLMTASPGFLFWLQLVLYDSNHGYVPPGADLDRARPLYYAASYGLAETVRSLVADPSVDLNERAGRFGGTAMHAAVWRERPEALRVLVDAGADASVRDFNGATPAEMALWSGRRELYDIVVSLSGKGVEGERETDRDRQIDRQTDGETDRYRDRDASLQSLIERVMRDRERALAVSSRQ